MVETKITTEPYQEEHLAEVLRIGAENYDRETALVLDQLLNEMLSNGSLFPPRFIVLKQNDEIIGFGAFNSSRMGNGFYEIAWINIDKAHQGLGHGSYLVARILVALKMMKGVMALLTTVRDDSLYDRLGFKQFWRHGKDRLLGYDLTL